MKKSAGILTDGYFIVIIIWTCYNYMDRIIRGV